MAVAVAIVHSLAFDVACGGSVRNMSFFRATEYVVVVSHPGESSQGTQGLGPVVVSSEREEATASVHEQVASPEVQSHRTTGREYHPTSNLHPKK